jgi:predicted small integral membrane protein
MGLLARIGSLRVVLVVLTGMTAVLIGLAAFGNVTDYDTNEAFVKHVLAMDTTFKSPNMMWRAITSPAVATAVYLAIIAWEWATAIVLAGACVAWVRARPGDPRARTARQLSTLGWLMQIMLFGGGFIVVGGEWFQMWQSSDWNGLQPALQNFLIASVGLVLVHLSGPGDAPAGSDGARVSSRVEQSTH